MNINPVGNPHILKANESGPGKVAGRKGDEARRFESLAERLVNVPKGEIDEKRVQSA